MKIWFRSFNTYFYGLALLSLLVASGCSTAPKNDESNPKKQYSTLRLHMEAIGGSRASGMEVPIFRARPQLVPIEKESFITEANVVAAAVVEQTGGGFAIEVQLDRQGKWLLEKYTVTNRGQRVAIFCGFGKESRWLAAPVMNKIITSGRLLFTPDATREEADRIVRGLNNMAKKLDNKNNW